MNPSALSILFSPLSHTQTNIHSLLTYTHILSLFLSLSLSLSLSPSSYDMITEPSLVVLLMVIIPYSRNLSSAMPRSSTQHRSRQ